MKYCSHCGTSIDESAAFCSACGKSQGAPSSGNAGGFWKGVAAAVAGLCVLVGLFWMTMASNSADRRAGEPLVEEVEENESAVAGGKESARPSSSTENLPARSVEARGEPPTGVIVEEPGFVGKLLGEKPRVLLTIPEGEPLELALQTALSTETTRTGDSFTASLARAVLVEGREALPEGTELTGHVAHAKRSGKVEGVAELTLELDYVVAPGGEALLVQAEAMRFEARSTKKEDAVKVGGATGAGALVGAIVGGKKGAAIGAGIGAGAGTGVVLSTRGDDVVLGPGAQLATMLRSSLTVELVESEEE